MLSSQGRVLTKARLLRAWGPAYAGESAYVHVNRVRSLRRHAA